MDFQQLEEKSGELILYLQKNGYSNTIIRNIRTVMEDIFKRANENNWETYRDIYRTYVERGYSDDVLRQKRYYIRVIERFDCEGIFPDRSRRSYLFQSEEYENLSDEYKELISFYRRHEEDRGKKRSTIYHEAANSITFLNFMNNRGRRQLDDITEKDTISFFLSDDNVQIRGCSYKKNIAAVFKAGLAWREEPCRRILTYLPVFREARNTIQYLTEEECGLIANALKSAESGLTLRDRAVGFLLLNTGMRSCDVAGLQLGSIDWENDRIRTVQRKTGVDLELPLTPSVGNAIFDYLSNERPSSDDLHVFLSEVIPHRPLANQSIGNIAERIFAAAGIRQNPGDRRGTHIFRHHAASHMLEGGVARPVISRILGHTAPDSLDPYLMADFRHLKECALSIEAFPVAKGVFTP